MDVGGFGGQGARGGAEFEVDYAVGGDAVEEGEEDGEAGLEDAVELAHALDDPGRLLGHEADDGVGWERGPLEVGRHGAAAAENVVIGCGIAGGEVEGAGLGWRWGGRRGV